MFKRSVTQTIVVSNPTGLHARPCLAIVSLVRRSRSQVWIRKDAETVDASEILQLMSLGAAQGTELAVTATGPDAQAVLTELTELFANHFGLT